MNVFITGGTTGIGFGLAQLYLREGHRVAVTGRDLSKLPQGIENEFPKLMTYQVNVTSVDEMKSAIEDFSKDGLDLVVANAGRSVGVKSILPDYEASRSVIETNVIGVLNTFNPALEYMLERKCGHIAAIASVAGFAGLPGAGSYSASKAAVIKLCESYSIDFRNYGIDVSCICPGFIDTPLTRKNDHPMPFLLGLDEGAKRIKKALDDKKVNYVFPKRMKWVMTTMEIIPRCLYRMIMRSSAANFSKDV